MNQISAKLHNPSFLRRMRLWLAVLVGVYALYLLIMAFVLPVWLKGFVEKKAGTLLDSEVHIGGLAINPLDLSSTVNDLAISHNGEKEPWLVWDTLYVNAQLSSIFTLSIRLDEFRLVGPHLHAIASGSRQPMETKSLSEKFAMRNEVPLSINRFSLQNGSFSYSDLHGATPKHLKLGPISFSLQKFSTRLKMGNNNLYNLQFAGPEGGLFRWRGNLQWSPFLSAGEMEIRGLDLAQFRDFYMDLLPVYPSGEISFRTHYRIFEFPAIGLELSDAYLEGAALRIANKNDTTQPLLEVSRLALGPMQLSTEERQLHVDTIRTDSVALHLMLRKDTSNQTQAAWIPDLGFLRYDSSAVDSLPADMDPLAIFLKRIGNMQRWELHVRNIAAQHVSAEVVDSLVAPGTRHRVDSLSFSMEHASNLERDSLPFTVDARLNGPGKLQIQGDARLFPIRLKSHVLLDSFPLASLQPYVAQYSTATLRQGSVGADLLLEAVPRKDSLSLDSAQCTGSLFVDRVKMDGADAKRLAGFSRMKASGLQASLPAGKIQIAQVQIQSPSIQVVRYADQSINLKKLLRPQSSTKVKSRETQKPLAVTIRKIQIFDASVGIMDLTLPSPFLFRVESCGGTLQHVSNFSSHPSEFSLQGKLDGYAPFELQGSASIQGTFPSIDFYFRSRSQELTPFSPYSGQLAGYQIAKGQTDTDLKYHIADNQLQGQNHVVMRHFTFGEKVESPDAINLPVRLGVALLTDKDGMIDLDVQTEGNLNDPEFSVGGMVWKVIKNLIGKAVAAPMKTLMALLGSEDDLQEIAFQPGSSSLGEASLGALCKLAGALVQRPMLEMEVQGSVDQSSDGLALQESQLAQKIATASHLDPNTITSASVQNKPWRDTLFAYYERTTKDNWRRWLLQSTAQDSLHQSLPEELDLQRAADSVWSTLRMAENVPVLDLHQLALARSQAVKAALLQQDSSLGPRVFVLSELDSAQTHASASLRLKTE
ncbi:MAG TPA: DUF748 domain-containing protein [Fibrobacteraceae bacterium]|nr:DUF748 domain-containing protein [Fibrobacteraceae bacterium]